MKKAYTKDIIHLLDMMNMKEDTCTNKKVINNKMSGIKSKNHEIFTYEINKRSLCDFDDKIYIFAD